VTKDQLRSSKTSIKVDWTALADTEPASGYILYMANLDTDGIYNIAYDGSTNPIRRSYTVTSLTTGASYGFKI